MTITKGVFQEDGLDAVVAVLIEGGFKGYDELVAYNINEHKYVDDDGNDVRPLVTLTMNFTRPTLSRTITGRSTMRIGS